VETGKPSQTAIIAALFRATHATLYAGPKIHEDTFALALTGIGGRDELVSFAAQVEQAGYPLRRACAFFALRHRYSEERLEAALRRGIKQVVLLGAGLDSFALSHPTVPPAIRFVEIDHPASQRWKLDRIASLGLTTPGVKYVPVDFSSQDLATALVDAGIDASEPLFVAWLGVTQYIAEQASYDTLSIIAAHAAGSEIVFDVILPMSQQTSDDQHISRLSAEASVARGEPWVSYFDPQQLTKRLSSLGFSSVTRLTPRAAAVYYDGQPTDVQPLGGWQIMAARV